MTVKNLAGHCPLCRRSTDSTSEFCSLHKTALTNLETTYASWSKAYGGSLTKQGYFVKLASLPETGQAVKEMIQFLRSKGTVE